jgi:hypothetical protein
MDLRALIPFGKKKPREQEPEKKRLNTAGYEPYRAWAWQQHRDLPLFTFGVIHQMLLDGQVRLALATRAAPVQGVQFAFKNGDAWTPGVKARRPEVGQFVLRQMERLWADYISDICTAQIWGWSAGEITLRLTHYNLIEFEHFEPRHAADCRLLKRDGHPCGVRFERIQGEGHVDLEFPRAFFHAHNPSPGDDYGNSCLIGAYSPWADKCMNGGALDVRRLFMHKDAYGGTTVGYPSDGDIYIAGMADPIPARDVARQIAEQLVAGGVVTKPNDRDENGNEKWTVERAQVPNNPQHILQYPKDLDSDIRTGVGVPDGIMDDDGGGAWGGKRVVMAAFYATLDTWVRSIVRDFCEQVIDPLIVLNWGQAEEYEVTHKPLAEQAMEQQSNAGPGQPGKPGANGPQPQQGLPGQGGPSLQPQQPARMSLDPVSAVGQGVLDAADLVRAADHVLRMSNVTFDESKHARDEKGRFTVGSRAPRRKLEQLGSSYEEIQSRFREKVDSRRQKIEDDYDRLRGASESEFVQFRDNAEAQAKAKIESIESGLAKRIKMIESQYGADTEDQTDAQFEQMQEAIYSAEQAAKNFKDKVEDDTNTAIEKAEKALDKQIEKLEAKFDRLREKMEEREESDVDKLDEKIEDLMNSVLDARADEIEDLENLYADLNDQLDDEADDYEEQGDKLFAEQLEYEKQVEAYYDALYEKLSASGAARMSNDRKGGLRWITVKPNGEDNEGRPVLIDGDGTIQAGMGSKNKGKKIGAVDKDKTTGANHTSTGANPLSSGANPTSSSDKPAPDKYADLAKEKKESIDVAQKEAEDRLSRLQSGKPSEGLESNDFARNPKQAIKNAQDAVERYRNMPREFTDRDKAEADMVAGMKAKAAPNSGDKAANSGDKSEPVWKRDKVRRESGNQIMPISGLQASRTSQRQLDRMNREADKRMDRTIDNTQLSKYSRDVIEAHEKGEVDENTPGISSDARMVIRDYKKRQAEAKNIGNVSELRQWDLLGMSDMQVGMRVAGAADFFEVAKINKNTVTLKRADGTKFTTNPSSLNRMQDFDRREAMRALQNGEPIPKEIVERYPELNKQPNPQEPKE